MISCILQIFFCQKNKNLEIIKGDIRDKKKLEKSSKDHDYFINLSLHIK